MYLDKPGDLTYTEASASYVFGFNSWVYYFHNTLLKKHRISVVDEVHGKFGFSSKSKICFLRWTSQSLLLSFSHKNKIHNSSSYHAKTSGGQINLKKDS